ncbi:ABC transporter permease [candidate division KSB1 bacterium]
MKDRKSQPPSLAKLLLKMLLSPKEYTEFSGDLDEMYRYMAENESLRKAKLWYWKRVLESAPSVINDSLLWSYTMLKNYIKIGIRNIIRHKTHSFISIFSLALGIACCVLVSSVIFDQLNYDNFHENAETIFSAVNKQTFEGDTWHVTETPALLASALESDFSEIISATRFDAAGQSLIRYKDKSFFESGIYLADPSFLQIFSFKLLKGDQNTALNAPNSIIISQNIANKYFSDNDPIGEAIMYNNESTFIVTGVMENIPRNSTLRFEMLIPFKFLEDQNRSRGESFNWKRNFTSTFFQIGQEDQVNSVSERIRNYVREKRQNDEAPEYFIVSMKDFRFSPWYGGSDRMQLISVFSIIAFIVLMIACINFMNLSTARSTCRIKEIGMRKVAGANRWNVIWQFLGESVLLSVISLFFAVGIVILLLPFYNNLTGSNISTSTMSNSYLLIVMLGISVFTGIIGGSYPAFILSAYNPIRTIRGIFIPEIKRVVMRKILVVFQFVLSLLLIICTTVIYKQIDFVKNAGLGYDKEHVIYIPFRPGSAQYYKILKRNVQNGPGILSVTGTHQPPYGIWSNGTSAEWDGQAEENEVLVHAGFVDYNYIETLKLKIIDGRDFSEEIPSDHQAGFIVNREMTKLMGTENVVGSRLNFWGKEGNIIGVVEDYNFLSLNTSIPPLVLFLDPERVSYLTARISPDNISSAISFIEGVWNETIPAYPFEYRFLDADVERLYRSEEINATIIKSFSLLAIVIACLGLFALTSFIIERRTKEIGIRKALGASSITLVNLLSKEFVLLVLISNIIAWPAAYYLMKMWLQYYAYRTELNIWVFLIPGLIILLIAILTISFQTVKTARSNPVDSLRYE